jgi:hypothetical protein
MKKIKVKYITKGKVPVKVKVKRDVFAMPIEELAEEMNLKNNLIDRHYEIENEYHKVDDIEDATEEIVYMLQEFSGDDESDFWHLAEQLLDCVKEDVIEEIYERDDNASEYENDKWDTYNRTTLPR